MTSLMLRTKKERLMLLSIQQGGEPVVVEFPVASGPSQANNFVLETPQRLLEPASEDAG
jgi:hypothetical protein